MFWVGKNSGAHVNPFSTISGRWRQVLTGFKRDERGTVAMLFGMMAIVLVMLIGGAVDMGRWMHLLLDSHELLRVNGIWMESFAPDMWSVRVAYPEEWHAITDAMPRLKYENTAANYVEARLSLDAREARLIDAL